jgi:hypothetical protein
MPARNLGDRYCCRDRCHLALPSSIRAGQSTRPFASAIPKADPTGWVALQLLLFEYDRTRPSIDLLARVRFKDRSRYIDLGCGPGNSTKLVDKRFPNAPLSALPNGCARQTHETAEF